MPQDDSHNNNTKQHSIITTTKAAAATTTPRRRIITLMLPRVVLLLFVFIGLPVLFYSLYRHMEQYHIVVRPPIITTKTLVKGSFTPLLVEEEKEEAVVKSQHHSGNDGATTTTTTIIDNDDEEVTIVERVHVIILVHGWIGCPQDLAYIQHAIEREATQIVQDSIISNNTATTTTTKHTKERFVVHNCVSNHRRTHDGIQAGGDRIAVEVQDVLARVANNSCYDHYGDDDDDSSSNSNSPPREITLSIVGFSLGGLYARYALPKIIPPPFSHDDDVEKKNHQPDHHHSTTKIIPKVFCTIATPNLGCRGHTYFYMPPVLETFLTKMTPTWRDLFHHTNVIETTVTDQRWIDSLLRFEKRVAYANAYGMDMMVPTSTAAFVTPESESEHFYIQTHNYNNVDDSDDDNDDNSISRRDHSYTAVVVETLPQHEKLRQQQQKTSSLDDMAKRLDAMGWTKTFVDFSKSFRPPKQQNQSFRSSDLFSEFHHARKRLLFPNGHDLISVNSKNVLHSYATRRGRPFADRLAMDLVRDILHDGPRSPNHNHNTSSSSSISTCPSVV